MWTKHAITPSEISNCHNNSVFGGKEKGYEKVSTSANLPFNPKWLQCSLHPRMRLCRMKKNSIQTIVLFLLLDQQKREFCRDYLCEKGVVGSMNVLILRWINPILQTGGTATRVTVVPRGGLQPLG